MPPRVITAIIVLFLLLTTSIRVAPVDQASVKTTLASHRVPAWGFRDSLNTSEIDYQNFWTDNAGKILTSGIITNDTVDANFALGFIQSHMTESYYLPEVLVNSSILRPPVGGEDSSLTNRIVLLGANQSNPELRQLSVGDYYASVWVAGSLGADRVWYNGSAHRAVSATVTLHPDGFVKRAYFSFDGVSFYTYLNATIAVGDPYVVVSVQVEPLNSSFGAGDHTYLQVFAKATEDSQYPYAFENATLFDSNGNLIRAAPFSNATSLSNSGMLIAYSNRTSTLSQDSVALRFNATGMYDAEHWYHDGAYGGLSWMGLGYDVPTTNPGNLSAPVFADVYPIQHLDFRLLSDTMRYITSNPREVSVAPPVSFGFVARGLAMESKQNPDNLTLKTLATGYWNLYCQRYVETEPTTAYLRSVGLFALAGFELYGGNSTVESFTERFVIGYPRASIEEYGWAVAALWTLDQYNSSASNVERYDGIVQSFIPGGAHFLGLPNLPPRNWTFQFGETASGLLSGGVSYSNPSVLWAMNAVYQSNVSGVLLNQPYRGDLANTETIPAYVLATWLFQNDMKGATGYWIASINRANITLITYADGIFSIKAVGDNGSLCLGSPSGVTCTSVNGEQTLQYGSSKAAWYWALLSGAIVIVVSAVIVVWRRKKRPVAKLERPI